ncbi:radical SAM protein [Schlegelella sp. S2-27]|uniref:Radical SAM protein n=1 Tax=Caldimonas mangrovi TaxID=2944811 RepID=A0ABT0YPB0_9BURK|nr:radical SAM protein [Caldimonas mangrovi]MCM5680503.1 radical SAM protein [Caldimonas mangrovi]
MQAAAAVPAMLLASRYNFSFAQGGRVVLFNARTGTSWVLEGEAAAALGAELSSAVQAWSSEGWDPAVLQRLLDGGFLVDPDFDEVAQVRHRYWAARHEAPMVVTVTTTLDCNLACYYCYEERSEQQLEHGDAVAIARWVAQRIGTSGKRSLHVDWYGGEPLLNPGLIEELSASLQALCREQGVRYDASIVSNGTLWPQDVGGFVARHALREVQISLDGLEHEHNRRRRYRRQHRPAPDASSFAQAVALIDALLDHVRVDLRVNVDPGNAADAVPLMEMARRRGWFQRRHPIVMAPARLAHFSERSEFMRQHGLDTVTFDALASQMRSACGDSVRFEDPYVANGRLQPRTSVCAALADDSVVFGADKSLYRCGLQVSEPHRAVGRLQATPRRVIPIRPVEAGAPPADADAGWWAAYDPTEETRCGSCSFLPLCWGGCPKHHLEDDTAALLEQCGYWRRNLGRYVLQPWFGVATEALPPLGEEAQFRRGVAVLPGSCSAAA